MAAPATEHRDAVALPGDPIAPAGPLEGSALSPRTWGSALNFLRERTVRR
jgi:hypothetical protein